MINTRLSVAIHIMSLVAMDPKQSSDQIAQSVTTNPVVIRRLSGDLKKAGLLTSQAGVPGFNLTRDPQDITLLDIYKAVNMEKELFSIHDKPNPKCPVGKRIQGTLDETFKSVQTAMENELNEQTLKDIMNHLFQ
ncbi:Rrf2 family transcriptional regulator [Rossellomorea marisflavi]|uniref:Transcriptional regulator n=1 Tax=Rossellomorea marisflavi TaxID=189381 RepID=A0A0J5WGL1_9BACI|nr:Rrf2 family transcriptional regulator [Rossellomorea marisflavi]KML08297.1 transcriptional regulator [Rossellomorea marisflavi]KON85026.1 transcriptional regulator [Rossellomorea marisflavi]MCM2587869.1 Rrf2 family transcriptional regulator [Rossellomorea marisflavi]MCM2603241.1 Rrf2 family transcriptional regulator [Rossellomorea marisflavi]